ncbi:MAG TPA: outer membrane protein assembly factor BamD [Candidatus Brocadiia bacterium]|nr:outer membrane protein assembly factor BamD [Candidatus Brocadiia bacterium]
MDNESGKPVPRAAIYIAETESDFFKPPRKYKDEVPDYDSDASNRVFSREAANRYLFLMADDNGEFTTVWRHDAIYGVLSDKQELKTIAFVVAAQGYSERICSYKTTVENKVFVTSDEPHKLSDNPLPPIEIEKGSVRTLAPSPIFASLLRTRYPKAPTGAARDLYLKAENAFAKKKYEESIRFYKESLKITPDQPLALLMLIDAYYVSGEIEKTIEMGERYVELYPEIGFAHKIIADAAFNKGDMILNKKHLVKAMQLDLEFRHTYFDLCRLDGRYTRTPEGWLRPLAIWK